MQQFQSLLARPGYRYIIIGGSVYLFELLIILIAQKLGASPVWAVAIAFSIGTAVSFMLQKLITFSDKRLHHRILIPQLIATTALILWNLAFSVLVTKLLQRHTPAIVTRTLALGITTIWNFYIYKTRIFKTAEVAIG